MNEANAASKVGRAGEGVVGQKINYQACSQWMGDGGPERLLFVRGGRMADVVRGMAIVGKERHAEGSWSRQRNLVWKQRRNVGQKCLQVFDCQCLDQCPKMSHWLDP